MNTVSEIARRFHVSTDTIRHYTKLGLLSPERDPVNGYRHYGLKDESNLNFILTAKKLGLSLKEIKNILCVVQKGETPVPMIRQLVIERVREVKQEILDAQILLTDMESALGRWQQLPNQTTSGHSLRYLIDTLTSQTQKPTCSETPSRKTTTFKH